MHEDEVPEATTANPVFHIGETKSKPNVNGEVARKFCSFCGRKNHFIMIVASVQARPEKEKSTNTNNHLTPFITNKEAKDTSCLPLV